MNIEEVIPVRLGKNNIIICKKKSLDTQIISRQIALDISSENYVSEFAPNEIYGIYLNKTNLWYRGILKFVRNDHVPVLQLVDTHFVVDYNQNQMRAKKIQDKGLQDLTFGEFKMVIYGVATWDNDDEEYRMIFDELLKEKVVTGIFGLIEKKENRIHECFACDLLFMFNEQYKSFREVIIKERITYPSRVKEVLNQQLGMARAEFLMNKNRNLSTVVSVRIYEISLF